MKKFAAIAVAAMTAGCIGLAGCSGGAESAQPQEAEQVASSEQAAPLDLSGSWKQTNSNSSDAWMEAEISESSISVDWVTDNGDTRSIYWVGSYEPPTTAGDSYSWDSANDTSQTENALLASDSEAKAFDYSNGELSFEVTMMGTTTTVRMEKVQ